MKIILFALCAVFLQSCTLLDQSPAAIPQKRELPANIDIMEKVITRSSYKNALNNYPVNKIRLVPITRSATQGDVVPEYRVFSIVPGSAYELIGLENGDILTSLEGYYLNNMDKFPAYMTLLQNQNNGLIEIRRDTRQFLIKLSFTE